MSTNPHIILKIQIFTKKKLFVFIPEKYLILKMFIFLLYVQRMHNTYNVFFYYYLACLMTSVLFGYYCTKALHMI